MTTQKTIRTPEWDYKPIPEAIKEWEDLAAPMVGLGFTIHSYDPTVAFNCPDSSRVFDVPVSALKRINRAITTK